MTRIENLFSRAMLNADGISFLWERPGTLALVILGILLVMLPHMCQFRAPKQATQAD